MLIKSTVERPITVNKWGHKALYVKEPARAEVCARLPRLVEADALRKINFAPDLAEALREHC